MSNDYFESADHEVTAGNTVRSALYNIALAAIEDGFDILPGEDDIWNGTINYCTASGTGDSITLTPNQTIAALVDGMEFVFKCPGTNTGAATLTMNIGGLVAKPITREDGSTLVAGDLAEDHFRHVRYNSTTNSYEMMGTFSGTAGTMSTQNASAVAITGGSVTDVELAGTITGSGLDSILKKFGNM